MADFYVAKGDQVTFAKTVGETDVYMFAGISGDFAGNHVNEEFMKRSSYGTRIAHGALMVAYMSTASTMMILKAAPDNAAETAVSLGYDGVRFLKPVFFNDTVTITYTIREIDAAKRRAKADIVVTNQHGDTVAVALHHLKWVKNT